MCCKFKTEMIVKVVTGENNSEIEWCSLEFQGDLIPGHNNDLLGMINIHGDSATLTLDYQLLYGQVISLEKPLLVTNLQEDSTLQVIAVIYKKIIFNTRPQPRIE